MHFQPAHLISLGFPRILMNVHIRGVISSLLLKIKVFVNRVCELPTSRRYEAFFNKSWSTFTHLYENVCLNGN